LLIDIILVIFSLALILLSCTIFTNAVEWAGKKLNLTQGVVGSIFAAIGTALPETMIPIMAILFSGDQKARSIGIGAIAGAPFMLSTLAFFITGLAVIIYSLTGRRPLRLIIDDECAPSNIEESLYLTRVTKKQESMLWISLQLLLALAGILYGAHLFISYVGDLSSLLQVAPLLLSIIITPIATELPEKINSIIWTGHYKDTLALGNITGSMVFQGCFPVVLGIIFTPWHLEGITMLSALLALGSASINLAWVKLRQTVNPFVLLVSGLFYLTFILSVVNNYL
jgi:cation:H+ antiporter